MDGLTDTREELNSSAQHREDRYGRSADIEEESPKKLAAYAKVLRGTADKTEMEFVPVNNHDDDE